ncbi:4926_t:CDS:1, partial [Acaulospora morrowiae]
MSTWAQLHDTHDLEILNNTLRTFASPEPDPDSHTAAKTKNLRKLRDDYPNLRINTKFPSPSLMQLGNACHSNHLARAHSKVPKASDSHKYDSELTRPGVHVVKFNVDPTHHRCPEVEKDDVISDLDHEGIRIKKSKQLR